MLTCGQRMRPGSPQHIVPRFTEEQVLEMVEPLQERIAALEAELEEAKAPVA